MGISKFMIILIIFTIIFLFVEKERVVTKISKEEKTKVSFFDSIMYEISETSVHQVVKSKVANIYDDREELDDATLVVKSKENSYDTNVVSSKKMTKRDNDVYLDGSVNLQLSNGTNIKTEKLHYNTQTRIAQNNVDFIATRNNDSFSGNTLHIDAQNESIEAKKTKFRMKVNDE